MLKRTTPIVLLAAVFLAIAAHNPAPVTKPYNPDIDPANFGGPIDNPYLPLKPGTVFTIQGRGRRRQDARAEHRAGDPPQEADHGHRRHRGTRQGVGRREARGAHIRLVRTGQGGNVWYMGEDSFDWEHGHWVRNDGSWTAGVGNGKPGVIMLAHPRRGDVYRQEYSPGHAVDQAKVLGPGGSVDTPFRDFSRHAAHARVQHPRQAVREEVVRARDRRDPGGRGHEEPGALGARLRRAPPLSAPRLSAASRA